MRKNTWVDLSFSSHTKTNTGFLYLIVSHHEINFKTYWGFLIIDMIYNLI